MPANTNRRRRDRPGALGTHRHRAGPLTLEPLGRPVRRMRERGAYWAVLTIAAAVILIAGLALLAERPEQLIGSGARSAVDPSTSLEPPRAIVSGGDGAPAPVPATTDHRPAPKAAPAARPDAPPIGAAPPSMPPSTASVTSGPSGSIRAADLANTTYPTAACPKAFRLPGDTFTLVNGRAGSPPDVSGQPWPALALGVDLQSVTYGDVTGDGHEDAAVVLRCYIPNSDGFSRGVVVVAMTAEGPATVATLPTSGVPAIGTFVVVKDDRSPVRLEERPLEFDLAEQLDVIAGQLVVRWFQSSLGGDALGDGYNVTAMYRIGPGGATMVGRPTRVLVPFVDGPRHDSLAARAIRSANLQSLTLPVAADGRDRSARVCPALFGPLGPVRDVTLTDGAGTVTSADGRALDASIHLDDIRFDFVDDDTYEDALVRVRCSTHAGIAHSTVLVAWVDGPLRVTRIVE